MNILRIVIGFTLLIASNNVLACKCPSDAELMALMEAPNVMVGRVVSIVDETTSEIDERLVDENTFSSLVKIRALLRVRGKAVRSLTMNHSYLGCAPDIVVGTTYLFLFDGRKISACGGALPIHVFSCDLIDVLEDLGREARDYKAIHSRLEGIKGGGLDTQENRDFLLRRNVFGKSYCAT